MPPSPTPAITVLGFGRVTTENSEHLVRRVGAIEQIDLRLERHASLAAHVAEINRAIDAASCDWLLLVREHESVGERLAAEIAESIGPAPRAFIVVPLVGAFLIDFTNALIITTMANLFR